jgi:putative CocE/NonD family hydrolase
VAAGLTAANYHDGWVYQSGAFEQWFNETWISGWLVIDTLNRQIRKNADTSQWAWKLPVAGYPLLKIGGSEDVAPYFRDWIDHPNYDSYWKQWSIEDNYGKIVVPGYHIGGWYDIFLSGTIKNYLGIKNHGGSEAARGNQRLLIGPWGHAGVGEIDFGPTAGLDLDELEFRWHDHFLKGEDGGIDREKPVKIFVMGRNIWREENEWPLARARSTSYYLDSAGKANSLRGDGALGLSAPHEEPLDSYTYDPGDPVPSRGGGLCCGGAFPSGVFDQRAIEGREDVLVYSTPPLQEDVEVTGPVSLELYASASTVDTDFTAKLVDVSPDGFARNLTDGIMRGRYRNSQERPELMNPGGIYKLTIDLGATSNVFLAGHRLRLEVSSSNFPRFDRNLNTGEDQGRSVRSVKARITIYHNAQHPSALLLSVVPKA